MSKDLYYWQRFKKCRIYVYDSLHSVHNENTNFTVFISCNLLCGILVFNASFIWNGTVLSMPTCMIYHILARGRLNNAFYCSMLMYAIIVGEHNTTQHSVFSFIVHRERTKIWLFIIKYSSFKSEIDYGCRWYRWRIK